MQMFLYFSNGEFVDSDSRADNLGYLVGSYYPRGKDHHGCDIAREELIDNSDIKTCENCCGYFDANLSESPRVCDSCDTEVFPCENCDALKEIVKDTCEACGYTEE